MTSDRTDRELEALLLAERRGDESSAPGFTELLERRARLRAWRTGRSRRFAVTVALALAALVVAVTLVSRRTGRRDSGPAGELTAPVEQLASWSSPTDFLLRTPGSELLSSVPALIPGSPAIEPVVTPLATKGVER